jgi:hypothetical protein
MNKRFLLPTPAAELVVFAPQVEVCFEVVEVDTIHPDGRVEHVATYYGDVLVAVNKKIDVYA